jgi:DNA-binding HxlR family transcriptional regulator
MLRTAGLPEIGRRERLEPAEIDPALEALVQDIIGRVADKWTMLVLETLVEHGRTRFTRLGGLIGGISQKMLTKTLRGMEADGLVVSAGRVHQTPCRRGLASCSSLPRRPAPTPMIALSRLSRGPFVMRYGERLATRCR